MQITCPCCAARFPIEAALNDDAARQALAAALKMPEQLGVLMLRYIALFRPEKRALSWARAEKLIGELQAMIKAGQVEHQGRLWAAPLGHWRQALEQMIERRDRLTLPLTSHGYLIKIIAGLSDQREAVAEKKAEETVRQRPRESSEGPKQVRDVLQKERGLAGAAALRGPLEGKGSSDE